MQGRDPLPSKLAPERTPTLQKVIADLLHVAAEKVSNGDPFKTLLLVANNLTELLKKEDHGSSLDQEQPKEFHRPTLQNVIEDLNIIYGDVTDKSKNELAGKIREVAKSLSGLLEVDTGVPRPKRPKLTAETSRK